MPMLLLPLSKGTCLYSKVEARSLIPGDYPQPPRRRELGLLDVGGLEILRCAQDDSRGFVILSAAKDLECTNG